MGNKRIKRLMICLLMLTVLTTAVTYLTCRAETYPDISSLDPSCTLPFNRQFFHRPGGGYFLTSTDNASTTMVTLLDSAGNADESLGSPTVSVSFPYEKAAVCGEFLYIAGADPDSGHALQICRFSAVDGRRIYNHIIDVSYDLSRGFSADESGNLFLVTVPYGSELNSSSPFWVYPFRADANGANCSGTPVSDSDSSDEPSSGTPSSPPSSDQSGSPAISSESSPDSQPEDSAADLYLFSGPVTVESLQQQLDADGRGASVRVTAANGSPAPGGNVGTGSVIEVIRNGQTESRVTAVVPGDLTGTGTVTEQDYRLLYEHVTDQQELDGVYFQAADVNRDGKVDTGDMLRIKSMIK